MDAESRGPSGAGEETSRDLGRSLGVGAVSGGMGVVGVGMDVLATAAEAARFCGEGGTSVRRDGVTIDGVVMNMCD